MDDDEARDLALKMGATDVLEFAQAENNCIAYTATWIRRRLKGKALFDEKKQMTRIDGPIPRWVADRKRDAARNKIPNKFDAKQLAFEDDIDKMAAEQEKRLKNPGGNPPPRMSLESQYIVGGLSFAGLSKGNVSHHVIQRLPEVPAIAILGSAEAFHSVFLKIAHGACFGSIGFKTDRAHAVALDCSKPNACVYFDPNIGEFSFPTFAMFWEWWERCFDRRVAGKGAWGIINAQSFVNADLYASK